MIDGNKELKQEKTLNFVLLYFSGSSDHSILECW